MIDFLRGLDGLTTEAEAEKARAMVFPYPAFLACSLEIRVYKGSSTSGVTHY